MEYMIGDDLKSLLQVYGYFDEPMAIFYTAEVALALDYLHRHKIINRDIKPDNMLISAQGHVKLTDFGLSYIDLHRPINERDLQGTPLVGGNPYLNDRTPTQLQSLKCDLVFSPDESTPDRGFRKKQPLSEPLLSPIGANSLKQCTTVNSTPVSRKELTRSSHFESSQESKLTVIACEGEENNSIKNLQQKFQMEVGVGLDNSFLGLSSDMRSKDEEMDTRFHSPPLTPEKGAPLVLSPIMASNDKDQQGPALDQTPPQHSTSRSVPQDRQGDANSLYMHVPMHVPEANHPWRGKKRNCNSKRELHVTFSSPLVREKFKQPPPTNEDTGLTHTFEGLLSEPRRLYQHDDKENCGPKLLHSSLKNEHVLPPSFFRNRSTFSSPILGLQNQLKKTPLRTPKSVRRYRNNAKGEGATEEPFGDNRVLGTPDYLSPELISHGANGYPMDWWALGVCLFEFMTGFPPFNACSVTEVFDNILRRDIPWPPEDEALSPPAREAILRLLEFDPTRRATYSDLRQLQLFGNVEWDHLLETPAPFQPNPDNETDTIYFQPRNELHQLDISNLET